MAWNEAATIDTWVMDEAEAFISLSVDSSVENSFTLEAAKKGYEVKNTEYFPLNWGSSPVIGTRPQQRRRFGYPGRSPVR